MGDMILYRSTNGFGADLTNYKVMTVVINEADSNPATCCSYADDAVNMQSGSSANAQWQEFFGYKPCLFKNGQVVGYLNPNDYSKFENGGSADITSGNAGDVMIEFPRRGIRCVKDGTTIRISMTDAPNDPDFKYYAHQRGTVSKDAFYIGAYVGTYANDSSETSSNRSIKMRSLSGQKLVRSSNQTGTEAINKQYDLKRTQCQNNGDGYECFPYVLMIFIQVMYVLQFKNLNSVDMLGVRFIDGNSFTIGGDGVFYGYDDYRSGSTNSKGLFFKNSYKTETSAKTESTKTFGIEYIGLRYFNVFGRRQDPNSTYAAVIPLFIKLLWNHNRPIINGDGQNSRDFTYIDNVIHMNMLALKTTNSKSVNQIYNTAGGEQTNITQLFLEIKRHLSQFDSSISNIDPIYGPSRTGDIPHSFASIDKARQQLGYSPLVSFRDGLKEAVSWYVDNL